jgi:Tol biopolymer transport system component
MALTAGTQLGPYEILSLAGAGGMGEVYRAKDTKLGRDVAIKLLPDTFAGDPDRTARFEREAKLLAALNHPNIAAIYGFEQGALVMELVEGDSPKGPMSFDDAWHIASQIAAALEYAHERGIVHRDLKPANIKITPDGAVKLLDFGLAKAFGEPVARSSSDISNSPTLTMATEVGVILGTAAYMAPEQAKGKNVDRRADIWSFGVVLYELLTGEQLFQGEDVADTLAQVLTRQPDWEKLPMSARRLLQACLEKDPKRRLRDVGDASRLLEEAKPPTDPIKKNHLAWRIAVVALAVVLLPAAWVSFFHLRERPPETPILRAAILPPENTTFNFNYGSGIGLFAVSPDGRKIVLTAHTMDGKDSLWVRSLDATKAQILTGTDGAVFPFWSPDSRYIGFFADGKLKKIDTLGGPPIPLADATAGRGGSWNKDNVIVFASSNSDPLLKISAGGGATSPVTKYVLDDGAQRLPWFLPDGKHFLYRVQGQPASAIRIGSIDTDETKIVGPASSNAVYARGYLFFRSFSTLMAQPFDDKTLQATGEPVPVAENVPTGLTAGFFSVSETGILVYQSSTSPVDVGKLADLTLAWIDKDGKQLQKLRNPGDIGDILLSPDQTKFAYTTGSGKTKDIWIYDIARELPSRFTFDPAEERSPIWAPDGKSIVFTSTKKQFADIYRKSIDLNGVEEVLWASNFPKVPTSWSRDGKFVLVNTYSPTGKGGVHIWKLPVKSENGEKPLPPSVFLDTGSFQESDGQFSPDGKWVAYMSNESQRPEIYVTAFPEPRGKLQISIDGGVFPRWSVDGKEIFYGDSTGKLMASEIIQKNASLEIGRARQVVGGLIRDRGYKYDVSTDAKHGTRLLVHLVPSALQLPADSRISSEPLTLISNWPALLRK